MSDEFKKMDQTEMVIRRSQISQYLFQNGQPKILISSPTNFSRVTDTDELRYYHERPMMLNAWTQTTSDDFNYLYSNDVQQQQQQQQQQEQQQQNKIEQKLRAKIQMLEENLRTYTDLLSQIHATSARKNTLQLGQDQQQYQNFQQQQQPQQPSQLEIKMSSVSSAMEKAGTQMPLQLPPPPASAAAAAAAAAAMSTSTTVINSLQQVPTESIKYTIIAEDNGETHCEPVEIQLAEEDGALMNSSADSGRLEICLPEDNVDVKQDIIKKEKIIATPQYQNQNQQPQNLTEPIQPKRRKISNETNELLPNSNTNYYFNEQGVLTTMAGPETPTTPMAYKTTVAAAATATTATQRNEHSLLKSTALPYTASPLPQPNQMTSSTSRLGPKMDMDNVMVSIGPNNTRIPAKVYENMSWVSASIATRKLLMTIFDRKTLATHSMTGKPSPAFKDHGKPLKQMLDPFIIQDIIFAVTRKCNVSDKEVRNAITTKCADENKMMKMQMKKSRTLREINKENMT